MKRVAVIVLMLAVASTMAACGDDDDEAGGGGTAEVTKAQYVEQANAICTRVTGELAAVFEDGDFPVVKSQVPAFFTKIAPIVVKGMDDLAAVEAPNEDTTKIQPLRDAAKAQSARWQKATTDPAEAQKVFDEEGGWEGVREAAKGYEGLTACEKIDEEGEGGEGDGEGPAKPDPATFSAEKKAYIEKADAICKAASEEDDKIEEEVFGEGFPPEMAKWAVGLPRFAELARKQQADLKKLTPPAADKATVDAFFVQQNETLALIDQAAAAAKAGNEPALITALQTLFPKFDESDAQLRAFGFQVCGSTDE